MLGRNYTLAIFDMISFLLIDVMGPGNRNFILGDI